MTRFSDGMEIVKVDCPYCGERIDMNLEASVGPQQYVEDCQVCCRPMDVFVEVDATGRPSVQVRREDA